MKTQLFLLLVVISLLFAACTKTEVVRLDGTKELPKITAPAANATAQASAPAAPAEPQTTATGKTPKKCIDTDADDIYTSGKVTVTYSDGTKAEFIDECPAGSNVVTEYYCSGNDVKPKNHICTQLCVVGVCIE